MVGVLGDFDQLWDFNDPYGTERAFRQLLDDAGEDDSPAAISELLTQIARAEGLQRRFDDAHRTLDEVLSRLDEGGSPPGVRYLLERGRVFNSSGSREPALPLFVEAWEAARALREDVLAIDAAHMIAIVEAPENQLVWNLRALELAESSSDPRARRWLGSLYNNIGWTYHDAGDFEQALATFERGLAWQCEHGTRDGRLIAEWTVGRALRSLGRYDEAILIHESLHREREVAGESDGYIHEELGECLLAIDRDEEARPHFAEAYRLLSIDEWLLANEPERLKRLRFLSADPGHPES